MKKLNPREFIQFAQICVINDLNVQLVPINVLSSMPSCQTNNVVCGFFLTRDVQRGFVLFPILIYANMQI